MGQVSGYLDAALASPQGQHPDLHPDALHQGRHMGNDTYLPATGLQRIQAGDGGIQTVRIQGAKTFVDKQRANPGLARGSYNFV